MYKGNFDVYYYYYYFIYQYRRFDVYYKIKLVV